MLVREGDERNESIDLWLACSLAAIAGAMNAAAFYAVGFFSANMTGNISTLSDQLALQRWGNALFYLAILVAFISGAACSAILINVGRPRTRRIYGYAIVMEALMLVGVGTADLWLAGDLRTPLVVLGLAFTMGFQNAVGTRISDARLRTTHISGTVTDLGIEMAAIFDSWCHRRRDDVHPYHLGKLRLQACTVLSFLTGGIAGVLLYRSLGGFLMILAAATLSVIGGSAVAHPQREQ